MVLSRSKWLSALNNVVTLCSFANFINSADRVIMPIAIIKMSKEFEWNMHDQGWILSSFSIGYLGSMILGAAIARKYGGKRILAVAVTLWSISTLFTPFVANNFSMLLLTRILLGIGEGLGMPTIFHIFSSAVNQRERSTAFGYMLAAGSIGQTAATLLCPHTDWPTGFYVFGSLGIIWTVLWCVLYRESGNVSTSRSALNVTVSESEDVNESLIIPTGSSDRFVLTGSNVDRFAQATGVGVNMGAPGSSARGMAGSAASPNRVVLPAVDDVLLRPAAARSVVVRFATRYFTKSALWAIYVAHFSMNWSNYIVMQWFPTYLAQFLLADYSQITFTCLPYIMNSISSILIGHLSDHLIMKSGWSVLAVRRCMTVIGLLVPGVLIILLSRVTHVGVAVTLIALSMAFSAACSAGHLTNHVEVAPTRAGITFAISNTIATIPGILCGPLTAELVTAAGRRWFPVFLLAGLINLVGAIFYLNQSSTNRVV